jgi:hypothetical protein
MNMTRRGTAASLPIFMLAACAQNGSTTPPVQPPSLADVQSWSNIVIPQLPVMVQSLATGGTLTGDTLTKAQQAAQDAQLLLPKIAALTPNEPWQTVVQQAFDAVTLIASLIPATASYVPLLMMFVGILKATILQTPVTAANGQPTPVPAPPTAAHLATLQAAAAKQPR